MTAKRIHGGLWLLLLLVGLVGCQSGDKVALTVRNDMKFDLKVVFEPQFDTSKPRLEMVRSVDVPPGVTKPIEIERGKWRVRAEGDRQLQHEREIDFVSGGTITIDKWIIRYQAGPVTNP